MLQPKVLIGHYGVITALYVCMYCTPPYCAHIARFTPYGKSLMSVGVQKPQVHMHDVPGTFNHIT